jgi:hypothetical protein
MVTDERNNDAAATDPRAAKLMHPKYWLIRILLNMMGTLFALGAILYATYAVHKKVIELHKVQAELDLAYKTYGIISKSASAGAVVKAIEEAGKENPEAVSNLPPLIYIHIAREDQQGQAELIRDRLVDDGYLVGSRIIYVGAIAPAQNQLRYFFSYQDPTTKKICAQLQSMNLTIDPKYIEMTSAVPNIPKPNQFEVWLGTDYHPQ